MNHHPLGTPDEIAALYIAGALPAGERTAWEGHLAVCGPCAMAWAELEPLEATVSALRAERVPPARLKERLLTSIGRPIAAKETVQEPSGMLVRHADEGDWKESGFPGVTFRTLLVDPTRGHFTAVVRMAAGATYPPHTHEGAEECLVLEGDLRIGEVTLRGGDYLCTPPGFQQVEQSTAGGCLLLVMTPLK